MSQTLNDKKEEVEFRVKTCSLLLRLQAENDAKLHFPDYELTIVPTKEDLQDFLKMKPEWIDFQYLNTHVGKQLNCSFETMSEVITLSLMELGEEYRLNKKAVKYIQQVVELYPPLKLGIDPDYQQFLIQRMEE